MKWLNTISLLLLVAAFVASGCTNSDSSIPVSKHPVREGETLIEYKDVNDLVQHADNIVIGTVTQADAFKGDATYVYTIKVDNRLKGVSEQSIDVYEQKGSLQIGSQYLLFLEYWENELYPRPVYTSVGDESIIEVAEGGLKGNEKYTAGKKLNNLLADISRSPGLKAAKEKTFHIKEKPNNHKDLIESADHILVLTPTHVIDENKYVKTVEVQVVNSLKGSAKERTFFNLPSDVETGKEYLVFLKDEDGGGVTLATRKGSIIAKDTNPWDEVMQELNKRM
ncbi:hypothetical protein LOK74_17100 [Brevibacillus humidisoli]|uniref:hypothetical protein n=1 Tax=Brevibacillus humidisoli TaxID=2895522 RepID=UPI001E4A9628|nr:hypothetical protein [Brevibacillus humidisoli]UFJ39757.1 hypothetical protein LOK74_17100 [Brevibacillus humidisoli]